MTEEITYDQMVAKLVKPGQAIVDGLTPAKAELSHMAIGICGEVGELIEALVLNEYDRENVVEEIGDLMFFGFGFKQSLEKCGIRFVLRNKGEFHFTSIHMALFVLSSKASTVLDYVKKYTIYNKDLSEEQIADMCLALDDCDEILQCIIRDLAIGYEECQQHNMNKLYYSKNPRYGKAGYSDEAAHKRADKNV